VTNRPGLSSLGVTVMPDFAQSEGVGQVVENSAGRLGCDVLCTMPSVAERCPEGVGVREPPADGGAGLGRMLDRPLWGEQAIWMRTVPSFTPDRALYRDSPFAPPEADELTAREGQVVERLLVAARRAGMSTQLQVMAAAPPGLRVQSRQAGHGDEPLTVFGRPVANRVDANISLASPGLRLYMRALVTDLLNHYPACDMLRFDWPEYPPYAPDSLLFDFCDAAVRRGGELGHDVERVRARAIAGLREAKVAGPNLRPADVLSAGWAAELLAFRVAIVADYVADLTAIVRDVSGGRVGVVMQAFPPPLNALSGLDFTRIDGIPDEVAVKHYTMHWPMIEAGYVRRLTELTGAPAPALFRTLHDWLGLNGNALSLDDLRYPGPDEPHPADEAALHRTVTDAAAGLGRSRLSIIAHGYGPVADVERRFRAAIAKCPHVHINRYGYLSDQKIERLGAAGREARRERQ
jgi:hypothetical protein